MTQAYNLSQFANKLNSSGATDNSGLQNSSVTITPGTGMSGGGAVSLGSSVTITNAGVTSIVAGSGISISGATGDVTITNSNPGGVTSAVAGNGIAVSGSTGAVTFSAACPTYNTVGSYVLGGNIIEVANGAFTAGSNYSAGAGVNQISAVNVRDSGGGVAIEGTNNLAGTWKWMAGTTTTPTSGHAGVCCRVS